MSAVASLLGAVTVLEVAISDELVENSNGPARYSLSSDGTIAINTIPTGSAWLIKGQASQAECYAELLMGGVIKGIVNSWVPLSTTRSWSGDSCTLRISIRQVGTSATLDTATVELTSSYGGGLS